MAKNNIPELAEQVVQYLAKNPQMLAQFVDHPYSTVQTATNADEKLDRIDMSQLLTAAASLASGQTQNAGSINTGNLASLAANLLGQNDNSIHSLAGSLFGGASAQQAAKPSSGMDLGSLVSMASLASGLLGGKKKKQGIDLSDGLGMDDLIAVAGDYLAGQSTATSSKPQTSGMDLGDIASIASMFLGGK